MFLVSKCVTDINVIGKKQGPQEPQKLSSLKSLKNPPLKTREYAMKHQKWLPYKILGGKTVKNVQIDSQKMEIWPKQLNVA